MNALEDLCFKKAMMLIERGFVYEGTDLFELTDLLIKIEQEKLLKNSISDQLINFNDEIVAIEDAGTLETIDIAVSGDNLFYCNGILTKNSFGVPMTVDWMVAMISSDELRAMNQIMFKQLKSRYDDPEKIKRFVVGVDRPKMRLYNVEESAQGQIDGRGALYDDLDVDEEGHIVSSKPVFGEFDLI